MPAFAHTPYDGSAKPFAIGLAPLDLADWIEPDEHLARHLAEKAALFAGKRDVVFREEPATRDAQAEVLALLAEHLPSRFPDLYERADGVVRVRGTEVVVACETAGEPPLLQAGRLVQEDLCLLRRAAEGYALAAAALCFPSSWSLEDKIGRPMIAIHEQVPGYRERLAARVDRIFENLRVEMPVWRVNWSIYPDAELHHPEPKQRPRNWFNEPGDLVGRAFVRVERQTLRRLPQSGDILFTIKVLVDPLASLKQHPDGAQLARALRDQIMALDRDQLAYKSMLEHRDGMVRALDALCAARG